MTIDHTDVLERILRVVRWHEANSVNEWEEAAAAAMMDIAEIVRVDVDGEEADPDWVWEYDRRQIGDGWLDRAAHNE